MFTQSVSVWERNAGFFQPILDSLINYVNSSYLTPTVLFDRLLDNGSSLIGVIPIPDYCESRATFRCLVRDILRQSGTKNYVFVMPVASGDAAEDIDIDTQINNPETRGMIKYVVAIAVSKNDDDDDGVYDIHASKILIAADGSRFLLKDDKPFVFNTPLAHFLDTDYPESDMLTKLDGEM